MNRKHLLLVLGHNSWGRAAIALRIAETLRAAGDEAAFITHDTMATLFSGTQFTVESVARHIGPLLQMVLDSAVKEERPSSIILCDASSVCSSLIQHGCNPDALLRYGLPLIAVDTWDYRESGFVIDRTETEVLRLNRWIESLPLRLLPAPILRSRAQPGVFRCVPLRSAVAGRDERRATRDAMGLPGSVRLVVFCSAGWQEARHHMPTTQRVAAAAIELVARCIERLGDSVHLVHVGPAPFEAWLRLGERYHAVRPLPEAHLDRLFAAADLMVSGNIAATTITRALVAGLPTVVIQNSFDLCEDKMAPGGIPGWMQKFLPMYPFSLWPLKYHDYLAPILKQNDYIGAFECVEMINEERLVYVCLALLFDPSIRYQHCQRQSRYLAGLDSLPTAAQVIHGYLG